MGKSGMRKSSFNRRQFLGTSGRAVAGGVAVTSLTGLVAPGVGWAAPMSALDQGTADVLLRVCRVMFPHDGLGDSYYATCVEGLDAKAAKDSALAKLLTDGAKELNGAADGKFLELDEPGQTKALASREDTPFFKAIHGHVIVALYNNPKGWAHFGYEGPSFPFGGYLERGFNDIDWLPES